MNHIIDRAITDLIEMLLDHKEKIIKFKDRLLEKIKESEEFSNILREEIGLSKIKRLFNKEYMKS